MLRFVYTRRSFVAPCAATSRKIVGMVEEEKGRREEKNREGDAREKKNREGDAREKKNREMATVRFGS